MSMPAIDAAKKSETIIIQLISSDTLFKTWKSPLINMVKCRREYDVAEQRIEHLAFNMFTCDISITEF